MASMPVCSIFLRRAGKDLHLKLTISIHVMCKPQHIASTTDYTRLNLTISCTIAVCIISNAALHNDAYRQFLSSVNTLTRVTDIAILSVCP